MGLFTVDNARHGCPHFLSKASIHYSKSCHSSAGMIHSWQRNCFLLWQERCDKWRDTSKNKMSSWAWEKADNEGAGQVDSVHSDPLDVASIHMQTVTFGIRMRAAEQQSGVWAHAVPSAFWVIRARRFMQFIRAMGDEGLYCSLITAEVELLDSWSAEKPLNNKGFY